MQLKHLPSLSLNHTEVQDSPGLLSYTGSLDVVDDSLSGLTTSTIQQVICLETLSGVGVVHRIEKCFPGACDVAARCEEQEPNCRLSPSVWCSSIDDP